MVVMVCEAPVMCRDLKGVLYELMQCHWGSIYNVERRGDRAMLGGRGKGGWLKAG